MNKVYGKSDLQEILDLYANQDSRDEAIARAEQLLPFGDILFSDAGRLPIRIHTPYTKS